MPNGFEIEALCIQESDCWIDLQKSPSRLLYEPCRVGSDLLDLTLMPLARGLPQNWPHRRFMAPLNVLNGFQFATDKWNLEAESDPGLRNLKSNSTQVFTGLRKTFCF